MQKARYLIFEAHVTTVQKWRLNGPLKDLELLPYAVAGPLIRDWLEAVSFLYDAGIVHLDMKLDNLFMRRDGGLAVGDLGLAKWLVRSTAGEVGGALAFSSCIAC